MKVRREGMAWLAAAWFAAILPAGGAEQAAIAHRTLFPTDVPARQFVHFPAEGFAGTPACGVVYRKEDPVTNGMPLGGIDTGCLDLETSGLLGYATIFNTHVPRRGPINAPILGLSVGGRTWVLCHPQAHDGWGEYQPSTSGRTYTLWRGGKYEKVKDLLTPVPTQLRFDGVSTAKKISYWGHYPVADLEFQTDAPVGVGLRPGRLSCRETWSIRCSPEPCSRSTCAISRQRRSPARWLSLSPVHWKTKQRQTICSKNHRERFHRRRNHRSVGLLRPGRDRQRQGPPGR